MDAIKEARLTKAIDDLTTRVEQLEASETAFVEDAEMKNALIRELNFRILFAMRYFQFARSTKTGVLDAEGKDTGTVERVTLWDIYEQQRTEFVTRIEANEKDIARSAHGEGGSHTAPTAVNGEASDTTVSSGAGSVLHSHGKFGAH